MNVTEPNKTPSSISSNIDIQFFIIILILFDFLQDTPLHKYIRAFITVIPLCISVYIINTNKLADSPCFPIELFYLSENKSSDFVGLPQK